MMILRMETSVILRKGRCSVKKVIKFVAYLFLFSFFPIMLSYYYGAGELENYQKALNGEYYLEPLTDEESDMLNKELDAIDISYQEKRIELRKNGIAEEDVDDYLDYPDTSPIFEKYHGHNPSDDVILDHISCLEEARKDRVTITSSFMVIIYLLLWWEKERV